MLTYSCVTLSTPGEVPHTRTTNRRWREPDHSFLEAQLLALENTFWWHASLCGVKDKKNYESIQRAALLKNVAATVLCEFGQTHPVPQSKAETVIKCNVTPISGSIAGEGRSQEGSLIMHPNILPGLSLFLLLQNLAISSPLPCTVSPSPLLLLLLQALPPVSPLSCMRCELTNCQSWKILSTSQFLQLGICWSYFCVCLLICLLNAIF